MLKLVLIPIFFLIFSTYSQAYLDPGIGGGIITATLGILIAIIAALFALIWFPIKKILKKRKEKKLAQKHKKID